MNDEIHGVRAGYLRHLAEGSEPCEGCRRANAAYIREYRDKHRADYEQQLDLNAARGRALTRLAKRYPGVFRRLLDEEREALRA